MRILASIILMLLVLGGVRAGDGPTYNDTCNYSELGRGMCGDQCIGRDDYCSCLTMTEMTDYAIVSFQPYFSDTHCCLA